MCSFDIMNKNCHPVVDDPDDSEKNFVFSRLLIASEQNKSLMTIYPVLPLLPKFRNFQEFWGFSRIGKAHFENYKISGISSIIYS